VSELDRKLKVDQPLTCRIRTTGVISESAVACWDSLRVQSEASSDGSHHSIVRGRLPDQAALMGVVNHLYNLGFVILSVECNSAARATGAGDY
jgi:hypothetical protein